MVDVVPVLRSVLESYALPSDGDQGVAHWARVYETGVRLARVTGADLDVVALFAVLHDAKRIDEGADLDHGPRSAAFARTIRGRVFDLPDPAFELLDRACAGHTRERTHPDVTIRTCWDADRLDLGRVGITPVPRYLGTDEAKRPETIRWADGRARFNVVPELVRIEWGIDPRARGPGR